ncbi:MAG: TonB-dependent receptor, partial [Acidobacteriota bacterium]|nr:TonB-dependent receptor [Acidobacteriota bacterium]
EFGFYVQDDWRVNKKLTLNLGLRYDIITPLNEAHGQGCNLALGANSAAVACANGVNANLTTKSGGLPIAFNHFSPRVGFAATLTSKTVLRGGFGISFFPQDATSSFVLVRLADIAMYHSKSIKGDCWFFYEPSMKLDFRYAEMAGIIRAALSEQRLTMNYQPIVSASGKLAQMEALIRIEDPSLGLIAPSLFIPVAERTGMIHALGAWALRESLRSAAEWWWRGVHVPVAVNVSPVQLDRVAIVSEILDAIADSGLPPQALTIEITESAIAHSRSQAIGILDELRSAGVRIALDDFGTGYSSLSMLNGLPIDEIKLDRSFVETISSPRTREVILQTVHLARRLGIQIVLEGIEEERQRSCAIELGCDLLQGFLIALPSGIEAAKAFVLEAEAAEDALSAA